MTKGMTGYRWPAAPLIFIIVCGWMLSLVAAPPASALTCPYPTRDVERIFMTHHTRPETYLVALGILRSDEPVPAFNEKSHGRASFTARFKGRLAQPGGFGRRTNFDVTVESSCLDDNCGTVPAGPAPALMFIRDNGGSHVLTANPCNDGILFDPTEDELLRALNCLNDDCSGQ